MEKELELVKNGKKTMTVKEVALGLGVSYDTANNAVKRLFPSIVRNGIATHLTEAQVACVSKELKNNNTVTDRLTFEVSSKVKNTTTDLEIIGNALSAFSALKDLYEKKEAEYKNQIAQQNQQISELTPFADGYKLTMSADGTYSMAETAKLLKLEKGNKTLFAKLRSLEILDKNNVPKQAFVNRNYFTVVTKPISIGGNVVNKTVTRVTAKGLDYIAKKLGLIEQ